MMETYYEENYIRFIGNSNEDRNASLFHFKQFAEDLNKLEKSFINEILDNCESLSTDERQFYINKLLNRIKNVPDGGFNYVIDIGEIIQSKSNIENALTSLLKTKRIARTIQYISTLEEACKGPEQYEAVKKWFIQKGLCDPDMYWRGDPKRGKDKSLVAYLKDLENKKYTKHIKQEEILRIAENSFKWSIKLPSVKATKPSYIPKLNQIPVYHEYT